jgi:hypothetical protein
MPGRFFSCLLRTFVSFVLFVVSSLWLRPKATPRTQGSSRHTRREGALALSTVYSHAVWIPAPDQVRGRLCAGMTESCRAGVPGRNGKIVPTGGRRTYLTGPGPVLACHLSHITYHCLPPNPLLARPAINANCLSSTLLSPPGSGNPASARNVCLSGQTGKSGVVCVKISWHPGGSLKRSLGMAGVRLPIRRAIPKAFGLEAATQRSKPHRRRCPKTHTDTWSAKLAFFRCLPGQPGATMDP